MIAAGRWTQENQKRALHVVGVDQALVLVTVGRQQEARDRAHQAEQDDGGKHGEHHLAQQRRPFEGEEQPGACEREHPEGNKLRQEPQRLLGGAFPDVAWPRPAKQAAEQPFGGIPCRDQHGEDQDHGSTPRRHFCC